MRTPARILPFIFALFICNGSELVDTLWTRAQAMPLFNEPEHTGLEFADFLYNNNMKSDAVTEYERYLYHHPEGSDADYALFRMAMAMIDLGYLREARKSLDKLSVSSKQEKHSVAARIIAALVQLKEGGDSRAIAELEYLLKISPAEYTGEIRYFLGWVRLIEDDDEEAILAFSNVIRDEQAADVYRGSAYEIHRYIANNPILISEKVPGLAKFMSGVVPGLGQVYAGDPLSGLNSAALNGSIAWFVVKNIDLGNYFQAGYIFYFLWRRYYFGGIELAGDKAVLYNHDTRSAYLMQLMKAFIPGDA